MCVILHKTDTVSEDEIADAFFCNPDGFGIMFQDAGRVVTYKGLFELDEILNILHSVRDREYIAHFRIATVGGINDFNCHPFYCGSQTWMMHNGTLGIETPNERRSDTWHFAKFLKTVKINRRLLDYLPDFVGNHNRLAFMNRKEIKLIGDWEEYNGNYWSNLRWMDHNYNVTYYDNDVPYWVQDMDYDEYDVYHPTMDQYLKC